MATARSGVTIAAGLFRGLEREAARQASSLGEMVDRFNRRDGLLPSTPTSWPAKGWITSTFGPREDPFTGERIMHLGIDLAAPEGAQVRAPAGGTITFVGERAAYGNMIAIDHGNIRHGQHVQFRRAQGDVPGICGLRGDLSQLCFGIGRQISLGAGHLRHRRPI